MKVELIAMTKVVNEKLLKELKSNSPAELIMYCARVSNPNDQTSGNTKLLEYCAKHNHWSVFQMSNMVVEIETSRAIAQQILRHSSFDFQEFCMSGDTEVYFDLPNAIKKGKRSLSRMKLKDLYRKWSEGALPIKHRYSGKMQKMEMKSRIRSMFVRVYDEKTKKLSHAHIKEVFKTGVKDLFEVELENGKKIKCTKEHKVLTQSGFKSLEDEFGLQLINNIAVIEKNGFIGCNGIPLHQSYTFLKEQKEIHLKTGNGVQGIADVCNVSYHTIRKWLKIHKLQFSKQETADMTTINGGVWNKGKSGYSWGNHSKETREIMSKKARKGKDSNFWKGGVTKERQKIQADINKYRIDIIKDYGGKCGLCDKKLKGQTDLHHIIPVSDDMSLSREYSNLMPTHRRCHMKHHSKAGDLKRWKEGSKGNTLTVNWAKIKKVKYLGKEMTYDLEIDHPSHNYVADGVIVHNSQRYKEISALDDSFEIYGARSQDKNNRQNSIDNMSDDDRLWFEAAQLDIQQESVDKYEEALSRGVAKEQARFLLPLNVKTKLYMNGSIRSWIHYLMVRCRPETQLEHREIANEIRCILIKEFPELKETLDFT